MTKRIVVPLVLLLSFLFAASVQSPVQGQEKGKPTVYTYVAQWEIPRAQWPDAAKFFQQNNALLDKLITDGTLTGYGTFESVIHREGEPTHGVWYQSTSVADSSRPLKRSLPSPPIPPLPCSIPPSIGMKSSNPTTTTATPARSKVFSWMALATR